MIIHNPHKSFDYPWLKASYKFIMEMYILPKTYGDWTLNLTPCFLHQLINSYSTSVANSLMNRLCISRWIYKMIVTTANFFTKTWIYKNRSYENMSKYYWYIDLPYSSCRLMHRSSLWSVYKSLYLLNIRSANDM